MCACFSMKRCGTDYYYFPFLSLLFYDLFVGKNA